MMRMITDDGDCVIEMGKELLTSHSGIVNSVSQLKFVLKDCKYNKYDSLHVIRPIGHLGLAPAFNRHSLGNAVSITPATATFPGLFIWYPF